jgi:hypothetical protein
MSLLTVVNPCVVEKPQSDITYVLLSEDVEDV